MSPLSLVLFLINLGLTISLLFQYIEEVHFFNSIRFIYKPDLFFKFLKIFGLALLVLCLFNRDDKSLIFIAAGLIVIAERLRLRQQVQFPICGGSDAMFLLAISMWTLTHIFLFFNSESLVGIAPLLYLGAQGVFSYFIAGVVKLKSADWQKGAALKIIFEQSHYPVPLRLRSIFKKKITSQVAGYFIILFELIFPLSLLNEKTVLIFLLIAFIFHVGNAVFFGIHRFIWAWLCSYPAIYFLSKTIIFRLALT